MKSTIIYLVFGLAVEMANAQTNGQFNGVLTYTDNFDIGNISGKVVTIISESDGKGRIDSKSYPGKSPTNNPAEKDQDILLYDFSKRQKTTLVAKLKRASVQSLAVESQRYQQIMESEGETISIENLGPEKIGPFNCTHFVISMISTKMKMPANAPKKNIWITKDLGSSNIWYVGPYLYYISGSFQQQKLVEAGATGIIVKWHYGSDEATLTDHVQRTVPSSTFDIPSGFATTSY